MRNAGLWLHPQGRLEQVLGIADKGGDKAAAAASVPGPIDDVVDWCAYTLDPSGEVKLLLDVAVERIAHGIMEALRLEPDGRYSAPVGPAAEGDARLVEVTSLGDGLHRITVKAPQAFRGWWLEFDRETPSSKLSLQPPNDQGPPAAVGNSEPQLVEPIGE